MHADEDMSVSIAKMNQIIGKVYRILKDRQVPKQGDTADTNARS